MTIGVKEPAIQSSSPALNQPVRCWLIALYSVTLVATAIVMPMCLLGNASGHDFQPHVASWIEAAGQWRQGVFFPRWAHWANFGYGEPRFIFYPPASWMLGGALGSVLPWRMVPGAFVWLTIIAAGMSMWSLMREWLAPTPAIAAAIVFAANPYHLTLVYYRSDFAELLASAFFPLMLFGALSMIRGKWRGLPLLAMAFASIWLSNAPAGVIATYSLALILVAACVRGHSMRPLVFGGLGMLIGFGLAAFYLVPAWWEQRWVQIARTAATTYDPQRNFLFTRINDPDFVQFNWKISTLAVGVILFTALGVGSSFKHRRESPHIWWLFLNLALAAVFLMLPPSAFLWRHLPELKFLQFPWRWLLVLNLMFAFFVAAGSPGTRRLAWWLTLACAIWATGAVIAGDTEWDNEDVPTLVADVGAGRGYEGIEGFQPIGANIDELDDESPLAGIFDPEGDGVDEPEDTTVKIQKWTAETRVVDTASEKAVTLGLKLLNYPAWDVRIDGNTFAAEAAPKTGQILLPLAAGPHHIEITFRRTRDRTVGALISALFAVALLLSVGFGFRRFSPQGSRLISQRNASNNRAMAMPPSTARKGNSTTT